MLILRRKTGESIVIGDNITLTVLDINEGSVRLAIDAPKSITILRSELLQAADANRDSAAAERSPSADLFQLLGEKRKANRRPVKPCGRVGAPAISDAPVPADPASANSDAPAPADP